MNLYFDVRPLLALDSEWVETLESGWNVLVGADTEKIVKAVQSARPGRAGDDYYGNGNAAEKFIEILSTCPQITQISADS